MRIQHTAFGGDVSLCGWYARQTISLSCSFLCLFWRETKQRSELEIPDETGSGGGKAGPREARGQLTKEPREGQLAKRDAERQSRMGAEGSIQDGLGVQCWTVSKRRQWRKAVKNELAFLVASSRSFAKNTLPAIVYKMHENLYKKVSQNYPSRTWSWPKSILFVCYFSTTPSVVFLVAVKKCVIPLSESTGWITGHE